MSAQPALTHWIYINLLIDQLWDQAGTLKQIFPIRLPEAELAARANEQLALYLSRPGDVVLCAPIDPEYIEWIQNQLTDLGQPLPVLSHPSSQAEFIHDVRSTLQNAAIETRPRSALFAGRSPLETALLRELSATDSILDNAPYNRKTFLLTLAQDGVLNIPPTRVISTRELIAWTPTAPQILKYEWGSGGGANFRVSSTQDISLRYLRQRLSPESSANWLIQDQVAPTCEGVVFGFTPSQRDAHVMRVEYDSNGLSYRHRPESDHQLRERARHVFARACHALEKRGYAGPIGLDFLVTNEDRLLTVDLNARWTKTHLIQAAAERWLGSQDAWISRRFRWRSESTLTFRELWANACETLSLDSDGCSKAGARLIPYSVSGLENPKQLKEICVFIARAPGDASDRASSDATDLEQQLEQAWSRQ